MQWWMILQSGQGPFPWLHWAGRFAAGRHIRTFQVAQLGCEVTHACVYHSGVIAVAYTDAASPPHVLSTSWAKPLLDTSPEPPVAMNGGAALGAESDAQVPMFTCMALQAGPPVRPRSELHTRPLQVRARCSCLRLQVYDHYSCTSATPCQACRTPGVE